MCTFKLYVTLMMLPVNHTLVHAVHSCLTLTLQIGQLTRRWCDVCKGQWESSRNMWRFNGWYKISKHTGQWKSVMLKDVFKWLLQWRKGLHPTSLLVKCSQQSFLPMNTRSQNTEFYCMSHCNMHTWPLWINTSTPKSGYGHGNDLLIWRHSPQSIFTDNNCPYKQLSQDACCKKGAPILKPD